MQHTLRCLEVIGSELCLKWLCDKGQLSPGCGGAPRPRNPPASPWVLVHFLLQGLRGKDIGLNRPVCVPRTCPSGDREDNGDKTRIQRGPQRCTVWPVPTIFLTMIRGGDRPLPTILRAAPERRDASRCDGSDSGVPCPLWTVSLVTSNPEPVTDAGRGFLYRENFIYQL